MVDPRAFERSSLELSRLLQEQDLDSVEDANEFIARVLDGHEFPVYEPQTPVERAQEKMYAAWGTESTRQRVRLAKQALKISPDCADAYVLLAEETAKTPVEAAELYRSGIEAGERALGPEAFERDKGQFWGILETRPYMRAQHGLALAEIELGNFDEAITILQRLLELNPTDNLGTRYNLLSSMLQVNDTAATHILLRTYQDDIKSEWAYGRALVTFLEHGNSRHARANLQDALRRNPFFPLFLLDLMPTPNELPEVVELGQESEGLDMLITQGAAWLAHKKAIDWLIKVLPNMMPI